MSKIDFGASDSVNDVESQEGGTTAKFEVTGMGRKEWRSRRYQYIAYQQNFQEIWKINRATVRWRLENRHNLVGILTRKLG